MQELLTINEAVQFAANHLEKEVTSSNITYLINYGRIKNFGNNGNILINKKELVGYYDSYYGQRKTNWKDKLGDDIDWHLSFEQCKESETTKHVHRLHPYKGKFIPQLVEYFLDAHTDEFKKEIYFSKGDIILDPFCGSGTTLIQANELGINAIGIDISEFNTLISNVKISKYNLTKLNDVVKTITEKLKVYHSDKNIIEFEEKLLEKLNVFNNEFFPSPEFKRKLRTKEIIEKEYYPEKEKKFLKVYHDLIKKYDVKIKQGNTSSFLDIWYLKPVRDEIDFVFELVKKIDDKDIKKIVSVILSRTIRSCRATTHSDLATLIEPVTETYYCSKHGKICKPLFSILGWFERYSKDTIQRISQFDKLRTNTYQHCFTGDSRNIDLFEAVNKTNSIFSDTLEKEKISGIFTSPPYVGLIDYHEQHAYAYDLFGFKRRDDFEIGSMANGKGKKAQENYAESIAEVLSNAKKYMKKDYNVFIVANDKFGIYPAIAEKAGMKIVQQFKRPVLNRTEKDKTAYSESIFHLKEI